ncbi:MAG: Sec-independent protein translocase protein TatB [Pseudomonadota bacterium]
MFDIGFSELLVIGVVALLVIGPERLPKVARTAGQWLGRLNRYVSQVKQDIDRDMRLEELRKMQQEMKDSAQKYEIMANETVQRVEEGVAEETGQISKVMEAMGRTDGGLTVREYEKLQAEQAAVTAPDAVADATPKAENAEPAPPKA